MSEYDCFFRSPHSRSHNQPRKVADYEKRYFKDCLKEDIATVQKLSKKNEINPAI